MTHAGVFSDRRLPRLPRYAGRSGTLAAGHVSLLTFFWPALRSCDKKVSRQPGRTPGICAKRRSLHKENKRSPQRVRHKSSHLL